MPARAYLSTEAQREEREEREKLRHLEGRLEALLDRRRELIAEMRALSAQQKELHDRRGVPQAEVERLHDQHGALGKRLRDLRVERDRARQRIEEATIRRRELLLTFDRGERERPELIRKEIARLELRQQTRALPIEEENELIDVLRQRAKDLAKAEARVAQVAEHELARKKADEAIVHARGELDRVNQETTAVRAQREQTMATIRSTLEAAGGLVAELRAKSRARGEVMAKVDDVGREIAEVEREGRALLAKARERRQEVRRVVREYAPRPRGAPSAEDLTTVAESHFTELMKRGRITLGG